MEKERSLASVPGVNATQKLRETDTVTPQPPYQKEIEDKLQSGTDPGNKESFESYLPPSYADH